jgi:hypothetical protein
MRYSAWLRMAMVWGGVVAGVVGCTSVNKPLNRAEVPLAQRTHNATRASVLRVPKGSLTTPRLDGHAPATRPRDDGYFVGVAISGGGLRSANFSAACMFQLQKLGLLDHVDYISSVSGGSLTAAYYCLNDDANWNPGNVQKKLTHHFATDGWIKVLMPWNMLALMFSDYDRSDILAEGFESVLFNDNGRVQTFADLRPDRPRLLMNATDLQSGKPFVFSDEKFDELNSDLSKYPIAYGVAASAAVPVLLHQVTLRDFSTTFKQYRHLIDGSINDNLGVKTLVDAYRQQLRDGPPDLYRNGAVFLVIDARTDFSAKISAQGDTSLVDSLQFATGLASTALVNRASTATLAEIILESSPDNVTAGRLRQERDELINNGYVRFDNIDGRPVHVVHIALSRVREMQELPSIDFSESVNSIETYFNIEHSQAYQLYQAADLLVTRKFKTVLSNIAEEMRNSAAATQPVR